jgi:thiamine biosynthesis lipoprotein
MGTRFEIVIDARETPHIRAAGEQAIAEIERLHRLLSFFARDSLLSHINRTASDRPVRLDRETFELFEDAHHVWRASNGSFDPARGSGMQFVTLDPQHRAVSLARRGVSLDLGAIAKGHAVDCAARILRDNDITRAFVHGGTSSIAAIGAPRDCGDGWRVAIAPETQSIFLRDNALGTSSASLRDHIVDPATGSFARATRIAAVIGPTARLADARSTAAAVQGARPANLGTEWRSIIA